jgi:hypothetical protein
VAAQVGAQGGGGSARVWERRVPGLGLEKGWMDEICCTNLKHWNVDKKKTSERYIGSTPKEGL